MSLIYNSLPEIEAKNFSKLEAHLGITFKQPEYLIQAFVHRSYLNEHHDFPVGQNERLDEVFWVFESEAEVFFQLGKIFGFNFGQRIVRKRHSV